MEPLFLSLDEVLEIHEQQIERYGGSPGLRDAAALESAVAMPQATFGGEFLHTSIPAMAAAYLFHLCQNHPFVRWQQTSRRKRCHHVPVDERLGADLCRGRTRHPCFVRGFGWPEQTEAYRSLRVTLQAV